jgi:Holliday junction resolvasome RuvABC endonuclease subunit
MDPSLTAFGYVVVSPKNKVLAKGCITTVPDKTIDVTEDDLLRTEKIAETLMSVIDQYQIGFALFEKTIGAKSYTAAKALALVKGVVVGVLQSYSITYHTISAYEVKEFLVGKRNASKEEVLSEVEKVPHLKKELSSLKTKTEKYAIADSMAIYLYDKNKTL